MNSSRLRTFRIFKLMKSVTGLIIIPHSTLGPPNLMLSSVSFFRHINVSKFQTGVL